MDCKIEIILEVNNLQHAETIKKDIETVLNNRTTVFQIEIQPEYNGNEK